MKTTNLCLQAQFLSAPALSSIQCADSFVWVPLSFLKDLGTLLQELGILLLERELNEAHWPTESCLPLAAPHLSCSPPRGGHAPPSWSLHFSSFSWHCHSRLQSVKPAPAPCPLGSCLSPASFLDKLTSPSGHHSGSALLVLVFRGHSP